MDEDTRKHISVLLEAARAQLAVAKKDIADAERAGLKDLVAKLRPRAVELENNITNLERVYHTG